MIVAAAAGAAALVLLACTAVAHLARSLGAERARLSAENDQLHRQLVELRAHLEARDRAIDELGAGLKKVSSELAIQRADLMQIFQVTRIKREANRI